MKLDDLVKKAVEEHCKTMKYSPKLTKIMVDLTKKYRLQGTLTDGEIGSYLKRIEKALKSEKKGA